MYFPIPVSGYGREPGPDDYKAYLKRIGAHSTLDYGGQTEVMNALHQLHLLSVPFENLDIMAGRLPIRLGVGDLLDKIVRRKRGGFCYELNTAFAWLLGCAGFQVRMHSGRVVNTVFDEPSGIWTEKSAGPEFDHMLLSMLADRRWYIADVGFGGLFNHPLLLQPDSPSTQRLGTFRITGQPDGIMALQRLKDDHWITAYYFTMQEYRPQDFMGMCRYHSTSPDSHFTRNSSVQIITEDGRAALNGMELTIRDGTGRRTRQITPEQRCFYLEHLFGMEPDEVTTLSKDI